MEPNRSSIAPQSTRTEKETLSTAALQWMRLQWPTHLFLGSIYFKTHCVLQLFSLTEKPANLFYMKYFLELEMTIFTMFIIIMHAAFTITL